MNRHSDGLALKELLDQVIWAIPKLFFRMNAVSEAVCKELGLTPGKRSVLHDLGLRGPLGVSEMARARPVARQYIQLLVSELADDGFVNMRRNPADARSKLVTLTGKGRAVLRELAKRHDALGPVLLSGLRHEDIETTCRVLNRLLANLSRDEISGET